MSENILIFLCGSSLSLLLYLFVRVQNHQDRIIVLESVSKAELDHINQKLDEMDKELKDLREDLHKLKNAITGNQITPAMVNNLLNAFDSFKKQQAL